jgi:hypothetical protein
LGVVLWTYLLLLLRVGGGKELKGVRWNASTSSHHGGELLGDKILGVAIENVIVLHAPLLMVAMGEF